MRREERFGCSETLNYLSGYLDKDIDGSLYNMISKHIRSCKPCRSLFKTLKKTLDLCRKFKPKVEVAEVKEEELSKTLKRELEAFRRFIQGQKKC
ncbi:hypothetical protein HRbin37_01640 [bacterium HR37]|nr:hypothetical protein HRbin37_01640 [bacterium HR37]